MKLLYCFLVFLFISFTSFSQDHGGGPQTGGGVSLGGNGRLLTPDVDGEMFKYLRLDNLITSNSSLNISNDTEGSPYLFKKWDNSNYIHYKDKGSVKLVNVNLNVAFNKVTTKIDNKIYGFDDNYFDYIIIKNRRFEYFYNYSKNTNVLYEVYSNIGNYQLLKAYTVTLVEKETKAYQNTSPIDKLKIHSTFFIKKDDLIQSFKFRKKNIIALFEDKQDIVKKFAKNEKLSFKKEKDLRKIIAYYNAL